MEYKTKVQFCPNRLREIFDVICYFKIKAFSPLGMEKNLLDLIKSICTNPHRSHQYFTV